MSPQDVLAESIVACKGLMAQYLAGFNSLNHTCQTTNLPNHVAWTLGHCALTMHRAAAQLDGRPVPESEFSETPCTVATDDPTFCFHLESIESGSDPVDDAAIYPSFERCVQIYEDACDRLADALRQATDLHRDVEWNSARIPVHRLAMHTVFHNGLHAGQIGDLRRALHMSFVHA